MFTIKAKIRKICGKSASRKLRNINKFPAAIYKKNNNPVHIEICDNNIINKLIGLFLKKENIEIALDDVTFVVKIHSLQKHSYKNKILHISFICLEHSQK